jgi:hypothetical protein
MRPYGISLRPSGKKENEPVLVNWRRGLFRVWVLFSASWIMGWVIYLIMEGIQGGFKKSDDVLVIPVLLIGPPIALLVFGLVTGWAICGFKANDGQTSQ